MLRKPSRPGGTAVTFREYACAELGMLQRLCGIANVRVAPPAMVGPPKGPAALRVSATRHGVTAMKCNGVAGAAPVVKCHVGEPLEPKLFRATICQ